MDLLSSVNQDHKAILEFKKKYHDLWVMIDSALSVSHQLVDEIVTNHASFPNHEFQVLQFWRTTLDYQRQSFVLIVTKQFDLGLGCLRLASELTRNSLRVLENPQLLQVLLDKKTRKDEKQIRDAFKFDETKSEEQFLYSLYKLCSSYGIHGHMTSDIARTPTLFTQKHVLLTVSETSVLQILEIWLKSFFPLQNQYVYYFGQQYEPATGKSYAELHDLYSDRVITFSQNLKSRINDKRK
ncbi:MAG: hypothetical protein IPN68_16710 [Bacteroidetes bacterium]|nr:hypothetical protein [Bacteroidota bacterium]